MLHLAVERQHGIRGRFCHCALPGARRARDGLAPGLDPCSAWILVWPGSSSGPPMPGAGAAGGARFSREGSPETGLRAEGMEPSARSDAVSWREEGRACVKRATGAGDRWAAWSTPRRGRRPGTCRSLCSVRGRRRTQSRPRAAPAWRWRLRGSSRGRCRSPGMCRS